MASESAEKMKRGWDKSPSLLIVFGLSSKTQWLSGLYYAAFISFYSSTQLCGGGTTKSTSNELPISVPLSKRIELIFKMIHDIRKLYAVRKVLETLGPKRIEHGLRIVSKR